MDKDINVEIADLYLEVASYYLSVVSREKPKRELQDIYDDIFKLTKEKDNANRN